MSSETELGSDVIVRCESLPQRWTSTFPGRMDVSTPGAFHYFRTLAEPTVGGISLNVDDFIVRELPSLEAEYPGGRRASHRAGGSGGNATPVSTIPCVVTKSSPSSNIPITWALTRSKVRTKPSSNVDRRVHARASLVRTDREFERFDHVGEPDLILLKTAGPWLTGARVLHSADSCPH